MRDESSSFTLRNCWPFYENWTYSTWLYSTSSSHNWEYRGVLANSLSSDKPFHTGSTAQSSQIFRTLTQSLIHPKRHAHHTHQGFAHCFEKGRTVLEWVIILKTLKDLSRLCQESPASKWQISLAAHPFCYLCRTLLIAMLLDKSRKSEHMS